MPWSRNLGWTFTNGSSLLQLLLEEWRSNSRSGYAIPREKLWRDWFQWNTKTSGTFKRIRLELSRESLETEWINELEGGNSLPSTYKLWGVLCHGYSNGPKLEVLTGLGTGSFCYDENGSSPYPIQAPPHEGLVPVIDTTEVRYSHTRSESPCISNKHNIRQIGFIFTPLANTKTWKKKESENLTSLCPFPLLFQNLIFLRS